MLLITGVTGFVGSGLAAHLDRIGRPYRLALRHAADRPGAVAIGEIGPDTDWFAALTGIDAVIHLAGRAHITARETDALVQFRKVNAAGTARLAAQAEQAGIRRFVLVSSVKAAADFSIARPLVETDAPVPATPYGVSKLEGELALAATAKRMETVVLRPPLVYGPGVKANFRALLRLVDSGLPLPFGSVCNQRSLIARDNLVGAVVTALDAQGAAGGTFYVTDGPPLSTPSLIQALAASLGKPARLISFPPSLLKAAAALVGRGESADSLLGSLAVDDAAFRAATGWQPLIGREQAFDEVARRFKSSKGVS